MSTKEKAAQVATQAGQARSQGETSITIDGRTFNLLEKGMCEKFVRMVIETAMDIPAFTWKYRSGTAYDGEQAIKEGIKNGDTNVTKVSLGNAQPGDIIYFNDSGGPPGHTAIYIGNNKISENTSSSTRGNPKSAGTKITSLNEGNLSNRITGIYSMFKAPASSGFEVGPVTIKIFNGTSFMGEMVQDISEDNHIVVGLGRICDAINYKINYDTVNRVATIQPK